MNLLTIGIKIKVALVIFIISVIGILIFYISLPISDTKLISDVKTTQSSIDYVSRFLELLKDDFADKAVDNKNKKVQP